MFYFIFLLRYTEPFYLGNLHSMVVIPRGDSEGWLRRVTPKSDSEGWVRNVTLKGTPRGDSKGWFCKFSLWISHLKSLNSLLLENIAYVVSFKLFWYFFVFVMLMCKILYLKILPVYKIRQISSMGVWSAECDTVLPSQCWEFSFTGPAVGLPPNPQPPFCSRVRSFFSQFHWPNVSVKKHPKRCMVCIYQKSFCSCFLNLRR